jgi:hypothetical protein
MMIEKDCDFLYMTLWSFDSVVFSLRNSFCFCFVLEAMMSVGSHANQMKSFDFGILRC